MKASTFEILMPEVTDEKLENLESAIQLAGNIFKKGREDFKLLYSTQSEFLNIQIQGESLKINQLELEKHIVYNSEKKSSRLLLIPFSKKIKRYSKPIITQEHNIIFNSTFPILTYKNSIQFDNIKNIIVPLALNEDFMPLVMKVLKFIKSIKSAALHIVSVLHNSSDYNINKATQQLSFLNHLFHENNIKYTAEIINSQSNQAIKSEIVLDHISRVNADLVVLYKKNAKENRQYQTNENLFEIISKSEVPIITFI